MLPSFPARGSMLILLSGGLFFETVDSVGENN